MCLTMHFKEPGSTGLYTSTILTGQGLGLGEQISNTFSKAYLLLDPWAQRQWPKYILSDWEDTVYNGQLYQFPQFQS